MKKIGIVTMSTAYLEDSYVKKHGIVVVDVIINVNNKEYLESDKQVTKDLMTLINSGKKFTTSQPSPTQFLSAYEEVAKKFDKIICLVMHSGLSGSYSSALIAKEMYQGLAEIFVVDTKTVAMGIKACIDQVINKSADEFNKVISHLKEIIDKSKSYLVVNSLTGLVNSGRIKAINGFLGNLVNLKPLLSVDDKEIVVLEKFRTQKKVMLELTRLVQELDPQKVYITFSGNKSNALELKKLLINKINNIEVEICQEVGAVISAIVWKGGFGLYLLKAN